MAPSQPSVERCLQLMDEQSMLANIRRHSFVVARVAETIHAHLAGARGEGGRLPSKELVTAGALLHDIAKTRCLAEGCDHAVVGAEICHEYGYSEVAEIVAEHVRLRIYETKRYARGHFRAKELIFYADKRVVHDNIVSLDDRLDYILERYGRGEPDRLARIRFNFDKCRELERWLCRAAGRTPATLLDVVSAAPYSNERQPKDHRCA